jgi:Domain of unknown function (DUF222)
MPDDLPEPAGLPDSPEPLDSANVPPGGAAPSPTGRPGRAGDHGSSEESAPHQGCGDGDDIGGPPGLSWCWELDYGQLLAALDGRPDPRFLADAVSREETRNGPAKKGPAKKGPAKKGPAKKGPAKNAAARDATAENAAAGAGRNDPDQDQDAVLDEILASEGRVLSPAEVTGRVAEFLPPGPGLAGWLATTPAAELDDCALAGVAASWRRLASWAQAGELAAVGQIAARAAARDKDIGVAADGRPARIGADATGEVCLALVMSQCGASWWTDLAVTLSWRLARTGAALRDGVIDLSRARLIAEATSVLGEDAARAVEEKILSRAGGQTLGQLRATLRRAVIVADPDGAERRREEAERRARVCLYPDEEGTATLAGQSLPGIRAAAAMARITAMARAMKASGAGGGIDLLRAQAFIGLLLGTLPYIPPAPGGPADEPPDDDSGDDPADPGHSEARPGPAHGGFCPDSSVPPRGHPTGTRHGPDSSSGRDGGAAARSRVDQAPGSHPPDPPDPPEPPVDADPLGSDDRHAPLYDAPAHDADPGPGEAGLAAPAAGGWVFTRGIDDDPDGPGPPEWPLPPWPALPASLPLGHRSAPVSGILDLTVPFTTLAGLSAEPGSLSRLGPVTAPEARNLAVLAAMDPAVRWRIILTNASGQAIAVGRVPRAHARFSPGATTGRSGAGLVARPGHAGLVGGITITIPEYILSPTSSDQLEELAASSKPAGNLAAVLGAVLHAADIAAAQVVRSQAADAHSGGCAHDRAAAGYRPTPSLREYITVRDLTCRFITCRQPAWRADLDHTIPWEKGGRTCSCNLGGLCRFHHRLKQHLGWSLIQSAPGIFAWTTPTGRTYTTAPDAHL